MKKIISFKDETPTRWYDLLSQQQTSEALDRLQVPSDQRDNLGVVDATDQGEGCLCYELGD